jgi:superfamily II DNA or RNA helicase
MTSRPTRRGFAALKDSQQKDNRDYMDIIVAMGMAKEGFDWIWCQHALTAGYRSSLTEIVQIIGRATRPCSLPVRRCPAPLLTSQDTWDGRTHRRLCPLQG